jgi:hypothetical protein
MRVSLANGFKKIDKAGGKVEARGTGVEATPKKAGDKKRASSPGDDDGETTPTPRAKRGRKKKQVKEAAVDCTYHQPFPQDALH